jgi:tRNA threonylcarbamoyladenosine biosynthesis protein TsaE
MNSFIYESADELATAALGAALADVLPDGTTVALCGTLGAGKTRLVQAIAAAAGVDRRDVLSPTFVLMQEHHGRRTICHIDAYRLRDEDEFAALGPEEYFDGEGLVLVEWADRVEGCLPPCRVEVRIEVTGPQSRRFEVVSRGDRYAALATQLQGWFADRAASGGEGPR